MQLGLPFSDYERKVGPLTKHFHEYAELILLHKEGVLPLVRDEDERPDVDTGPQKTSPRTTVSGRAGGDVPDAQDTSSPDKRDLYQCNGCGDPLSEPGELCEHCKRARRN